MKLADVLKMASQQLPKGVANIDVIGISLDSRKIDQGDIFVALKGETFDGNAFIAKAIAEGAVVVLREGVELEIDYCASVPCITLPGLKARLGEIAGELYGNPTDNLCVIGVTGTNGKSTCVSLISQAFSALGKPAWQLGTVGYGAPGSQYQETGFTTPDAIQCQRIFAEARRQVEVVAMEVSSHSVVQHRISGIRFDVGVFTNITRDHLDYHESFEDYCEAKLTFLRDFGHAFVVLNLDDEFAQQIVEKTWVSESKNYSFSVGNSKADVWAEVTRSDLKGVSAIVRSPWGVGELNSSLVGDFNISNLLAVITVLGASGYAFDAILSVVKKLEGVEGRMQKVLLNSADLPPVFIDYAHTPDALLKAIQTLKHAENKKLWVVFGCGGDRDRGKRAQMAEIASRYADHIVLTSDNPRSEDPHKIIEDMCEGLDDSFEPHIYVEREKAIEFAVESAANNDCLLIAGKGHEKYQLIGDKKLPFDDYLVVQNALANRSQRLTKTGGVL